MSKPTLTIEQARSLIESIVAEKGADYVYQPATFDWSEDKRPIPAEEYDEDNEFHTTACVYTSNGAPSCLVGHVLHRAGVPLGAFADWEDTSARSVVPELVDTDDTVTDALQAAQGAQDNGKPWGEALRAFQAVLDMSEDAA